MCVCASMLHLDVQVGPVAQVGLVALKRHQKKIVLKQKKTLIHYSQGN